jgi:twinfilin-like protein
MHGSGIEVDEKLKGEWAALGDDVAFVRVEIEDDKFNKVEEGKQAGSWDDNWAAVQATLKPSAPCYILLREEKGPKWVFMPYVPDSSHVRKKMLYASSQGALKRGLGGNQIAKDYYITTAKECTAEGFNKSDEAVDREQMMTYDEQDAWNAHTESHLAMDDKAQAIVGVPIDITEDALAAIKGVGSGHNTVVLGVKGDSEELSKFDSGDFTLEDVGKTLPENEPRYIFHAFTAENNETSNVFIYYCPGKAPPRARMFYSTCKANVLKVIENLGLGETKRLECDMISEVSTQEVQSQLYPVVVEKKKISKPKGRSKAKFRGAKFSAS